MSAIETGTAAENSGLQVGDIIISINDMCVLDASHSEFVNVAHSGSDVLELEVARTCDILTPVIDPVEIDRRIVIASKLWKFSIGTKKMKNCWQPRYFCLKTDNCLYYYKSASLKRVRCLLFVFIHLGVEQGLVYTLKKNLSSFNFQEQWIFTGTCELWSWYEADDSYDRSSGEIIGEKF